MSTSPTPRLAETAHVLTVPSEEAMYDFLTGLNVSGVNPEVPCATVDQYGSATFLSTLTDPDAAHVNYVYSDEGGHSRCIAQCENCGSEGDRDDWSPTYPVLALVTEWPDAQRLAENDFIDPWWLRLSSPGQRQDGGQ